jgi:hypothetical protein
MNRIETFKAEVRRAAVLFHALTQQKPVVITVVHHNDADGIAAAAILARVFERLVLAYRLLPVEKIHASLVEKIHTDRKNIVIYADLGGQSSGLISSFAEKSRQVIILDHHLPGAKGSAGVIHLNPEHHGLSGDDDAAGAAVCAVFARELLGAASLSSANDAAALAALAVIGAYGDGQQQGGRLSGLNKELLETAIEKKAIHKDAEMYTLPCLPNRPVEEVVEIVNLLGSVGFYSGDAGLGVDFLLGRNTAQALRRAHMLSRIKTKRFTAEVQLVRGQGLEGSPHFEWIDVRDRFVPMGVKAIGLFLEYLIDKGLASTDKYLLGFQPLPLEAPGIGRLEPSSTKISARVHPDMKKKIHANQMPDFMTLIPEAAARVEGTADGCHRFAAAALIRRGREAAFIKAIEKVLANYL